MTRTTNILLVLITLSAAGAAMGCSAIVGSKLDEKGDGSVADSGPWDSGTADTGETLDCREEDDQTAFCQSFECIEDGVCAPEEPDADPTTGCVFTYSPDGEECEGFRFDDETTFEGMCRVGFCGGCGDGEINGAEDCADENSINGDGCENDCTFTCEVDTDCDFDCAAPRRCDPASAGAPNVCLPVADATLPPMGTSCEVMRVDDPPLMGMCEFRTGGELCCGPPLAMGRVPCCGIFSGESTIRCEVVMLPVMPPP